MSKKKHNPSSLAVRLAAEKVFVEITALHRPTYSTDRRQWWQQPSTIYPLESSIDVILSTEFDAKFNYLRGLLQPIIDNCTYCSGSGQIMMGVNNTITTTNCLACFPLRETLRLLPPEYQRD